nr:hypothetical protein [Tanacetum cinerariifolium]
VSDKSKVGLGYKAQIPKSFVNSSELLEKQNNRSTKGYHEVPSPLTRNYMPPKHDPRLIDEHFESESVEVSTVSSSANKTIKTVDITHKGVLSTEEPKSVIKNKFDPPIIEDWHSDDDIEDGLSPIIEVKTVKPSVEKIEFIKNPREIVKTAESHKPHKHNPRGNKRNWNNLMSHRLGSNFKLINKACYVCGSFERLQYVCDKKDVRPIRTNPNRVNHKKIANKFTHPHPKRDFVPQAVLTRSAKINTAAGSVNTAKTRPFNKLSSNKRSAFNKKVNTIRVNDSTARERAVVSRNMRREVNAIKASACWVWKAKNSSASTTFKKYFYIDARVVTGNQTNGIAGTKEKLVAGQDAKKKELEQEYILIPICKTSPLISQDAKDSVEDPRKKAPEVDAGETLDNGEQDNQVSRSEDRSLFQQDRQTKHNNSTNDINTVSSPVSIAGPSFVNVASQIPLNAVGPFASTNDFEEHSFERFSPFKNAVSLPHVPMFLKDHPQEQVIGSLETLVQTRHTSKAHEEFGLLSLVHKLRRTNHKDFQNCLFACFLSQMEPKKPVQALQDPSWVEAMQEELLQFKLLKGHTQEEGIDYDEVFALVARIEAIRLFLAYASFKDFVVYQMDVKSAFLYGKIEEEVYVCQPLGFKDLNFPDKVYKVEKALYGLHQAPRAWYETLSTYLLDNGFHKGQINKTLFIKRYKDDILLVQVYVDDIIFWSTKKELSNEFEKLMHDKFQMSSMGELSFLLGLQVKQNSDGIFISQDKYVAEILKKFYFITMKTASTPMKSNKPLIKDEEAEDVDVHLYRLMIGSLIYLTASRPDITFVVCLWYPKDSPFDLKAYSDSDYAGASLDRKSTTGGCQFLGKRLISWKCKKHTIVANFTTEAEYVVATNCCG